MKSTQRRIALATIAALTIGARPAPAQTVDTWVGGIGNWLDFSNWADGSPPDANTRVVINNGGTAQVTTLGPVAERMKIGSSDTGFLEVSDGGQLNSDTTEIAFDLDSTGSVTVSDTDSLWDASGGISVGFQGAGVLRIETGGAVTATGLSVVGHLDGSNGTMFVEGPGANFTVSDSFFIGSQGDGSLTVLDGGVVDVGRRAEVGEASGGEGRIHVTGGGATLRAGSNSSSIPDILVGKFSNGTLTVSGGGKVQTFGDEILIGGGSPGELNIGASTTGAIPFSPAPGIIDAPFVEGGDGAAVVNFDHTDADYYFTTNGASDGGAVPITGSAEVNHIESGSTTLTGNNTYTGGTNIHLGTLRVDAGSIFHPDADMIVGDGAGDDGALLIENEGRVTNQFANVAVDSTAQGAVTVSGLNSIWISESDLRIGRGGSGELLVDDGAGVFCRTGVIGDFAGSVGNVTVTGPGSRWDSSNFFFIGVAGEAALTVADRGEVVVDDSFQIASTASSTGTLNIGDGGAAGVIDAASVHGGDGVATLNFNHTDAGHHFTSDGTSAGDSVSITGSTSVNHIGSGATTLAGFNLYTGGTTVNQGELRVTGAVIHPESLLVVGDENGDDGMLRITNGGDVTSRFARIAASAGSVGHAEVSGAGSTWTNMDENGLNDIHVGLGGVGSLDVNSQGLVQGRDGTIGLFAGGDGSVVVSGAGSEWFADRDMIVGGDGAGELTLKDGGVALIGASGGVPQVGLALGFGSTGALHIGDGGAPGVVNAAQVVGGPGDATVNFNHTADDYVFSTDGTSSGDSVGLLGSTSVHHLGVGTTTLIGEQLFTGPTTVDAGTLRVDGTLSNSVVTVNEGGGVLNGGVLSGVGSVGTVVVKDFGAIAPGASVGTLTVTDLTLDDRAFLEFDVGAPGRPNDRIAVQGDHVALDGVVSITDAGGLDPTATYVLMTYDGTAVDNGLELSGIVPVLGLAIDTSVPGKVLLTSDCPGDLNGSGEIDGADLGVLLLGWGPCQ